MGGVSRAGGGTEEGMGTCPHVPHPWAGGGGKLRACPGPGAPQRVIGAEKWAFEL